MILKLNNPYYIIQLLTLHFDLHKQGQWYKDQQLLFLYEYKSTIPKSISIDAIQVHYTGTLYRYPIQVHYLYTGTTHINKLQVISLCPELSAWQHMMNISTHFINKCILSPSDLYWKKKIVIYVRTAHQINIPTRSCKQSEFMMVYRECNVM